MNYIKQLEARVEELERDRRRALEGLDLLAIYLVSVKFRCGDVLDGYVNVKDVHSRLAEVRQCCTGEPLTFKRKRPSV